MNARYDDVLDALDEAPLSRILDEQGGIYDGPVATIQWLALQLSVSESTVRRAVYRLKASGLVNVSEKAQFWSGRSRLVVTGMA